MFLCILDYGRHNGWPGLSNFNCVYMHLRIYRAFASASSGLKNCG